MATVSVSEIAAVVGMHWITVARQAIREKWPSFKISSKQRFHRRFPVDRLPIGIRLSILKYESSRIDRRLELQAMPARSLSTENKEDSGQWLSLKDWQWDVFEARLAIVHEFEQLKERHGTSNAIRMLLAMADEDILPPPLSQYAVQANGRRGNKRKLSRSSLLRWHRTTQKEGILGLIPADIEKRKDESWVPYLKEVINIAPGPSVAEALEKLKRILPERIKAPSYHQILRALKKECKIEKIYKGAGIFAPAKRPGKKWDNLIYVVLKVDIKKPHAALKHLDDIISQRPEINRDVRLSFSRSVNKILPLLVRRFPLYLNSPLTEKEIEQLNKYKFGKHKKNSAKANAILMADEGASLLDVGIATSAPKGKIFRWLREFNIKRMGSIEVTVHSPEREMRMELVKNRVIDIIHNLPEAYGINRASWTYKTISTAYTQSYGEYCSPWTVSRMVKSTGYTWRRAKKVWTSPDPHYKEKIVKVLDTLQGLKDGELFFFIDEAGPYQVKHYGGVLLVEKGYHPKIPEHQKSRGSVQFIAALEARTNQVIWSFIHSKNTKNIIFLLAQLCDLYPASPRIFVTWDSISSHRSRDLISWQNSHNRDVMENGHSPFVEIVPLPSRAQFLNVIEAVFSGMKRAVIHNSNYGSKKDMKLAISRHFEERNLFFKANPKRAGNKIWDRESFDLNKLAGGLFRKM